MSIWSKAYTIEELNSHRHANMTKYLGMEFLEIGDDYLKARMPVDERTMQPFGFFHGGASCVLSESLGSIAAWMCIDSDKQRAFGIEINANHIRPVTEGFVTGICKPIQIGRGIHVWNTEMFRGDDKLSCVSRLTVAIKDI